MKFAIAQLNPTVGDLEGNANKLFTAYKEASLAGADIMIAPECVLTGYPIEDLVLRDSFMLAVNSTIETLYKQIMESGLQTAIIFGTPITYTKKVSDFFAVHPHWANDYRNKPKFNAAIFFDPASTKKDFVILNDHKAIVTKQLLPNYGVFDEKRIFSSGGPGPCVVFRDNFLGLMICEDCWFPRISESLAKSGAQILISINGSPYEVGKNVTRRQIVAKRIKETGIPFLYVNLVGGQDELIFDGGSFYYDGDKLQEAPHFQEGIYYFDVELNPRRKAIPKNSRDVPTVKDLQPRISLDNYPTVDPSGVESIYQACVLGTRDYLNKQGFKSVVLGMSGGVDSGLVAAIACDAFGPENVNLVRLPSKYSSEGSLTDAGAASLRLGAHMRTIPIEPVVEALRQAYSSTNGNILTGVADENIQARARGSILMSISNQEGHILLGTTNRSEGFAGFGTLYGDSCAGFNPLKDIYKTVVWELCRWRNVQAKERLAELDFKGQATVVVPEEIISKPPSAELKPNQVDTDALPPYEIMDGIMRGLIDQEKSIEKVSQTYDKHIVERVWNMIGKAEFKRRQGAPGLKVTSKLHGRDRRYPIVNAWRK